MASISNTIALWALWPLTLQRPVCGQSRHLPGIFACMSVFVCAALFPWSAPPRPWLLMQDYFLSLASLNQPESKHMKLFSRLTCTSYVHNLLVPSSWICTFSISDRLIAAHLKVCLFFFSSTRWFSHTHTVDNYWLEAFVGSWFCPWCQNMLMWNAHHVLSHDLYRWRDCAILLEIP